MAHPATYTLRVRRFDPDSNDGPYWQDFEIEQDPTLSVLDALLKARAEQDGSLVVRCSCKAAICGSCGVKINGQSTLACLTQVGDAHDAANRRSADSQTTPPGSSSTTPGPAGSANSSNPIVVEPMGNMPVVKDLVTDMESTHWAKYRRVTPWLIPEGPPPEREYIVPAEAMLDVTQTMACIQCGACVSACLSMEADPGFIGPAALAKAYRFVGDPRDGQTEERLHDLANDPNGIFECTHCFACVDACPKDVAPMDQIMRLRRIASHDHGIVDANNGVRHELAFTKIIRDKGTLDESLLLQESYAPGIVGKLKPPPGAIKAMITSIPTAIRGIRTGKMRSLKKLIPGVHAKLPGDAQDHVKRVYERAEDSRRELNLYITEGESPEGEEPEHVPARGYGAATPAFPHHEHADDGREDAR